jgi:hypothetical protein
MLESHHCVGTRIQEFIQSKFIFGHQFRTSSKSALSGSTCDVSSTPIGVLYGSSPHAFSTNACAAICGVFSIKEIPNHRHIFCNGASPIQKHKTQSSLNLFVFINSTPTHARCLECAHEPAFISVPKGPPRVIVKPMLSSRKLLCWFESPAARASCLSFLLSD